MEMAFTVFAMTYVLLATGDFVEWSISPDVNKRKRPYSEVYLEEVNEDTMEEKTLSATNHTSNSKKLN